MRSHDLNGGESQYAGPCDYPLDGLGAARMGDKRRVVPARCNAPSIDTSANGYRSCSSHAQARATSCLLESIVDEAIELLSFIDQPNSSTVLYTVETRENL